jgi:hypothetical protein
MLSGNVLHRPLCGPASTDVKYMGRTAIAWLSNSAHNLAAYSHSELGFATHFNMYPEVQLPSPNGSLGHTRGQVNFAMARSKALINAGMPVYFVWNRKSHIANGTAKSIGFHSVSNTRCHGISVDDCAKTENLYTPYEAVPGPCWVLEPLRMGYTRSCVAHNRRSKCHQKLPLEL